MKESWFGSSSDLYKKLIDIGAQQTEDGDFLIKGSIFFGLGDKEAVVGPDVYVLVAGKECQLLAELQKPGGSGICILAL